MTAYHYPGLFGDPRSGRIWPLFFVSILLHAGLFAAFSRFHIRRVDHSAATPIQVVELGGPKGVGRSASPKVRTQGPPLGTVPPPAQATKTEARAELPPPEKPVEKVEPRVAAGPPKPTPPAKLPPTAPAPEPPEKTIPKLERVPPPKRESEQPKREEGTEARVAETIARLRARQEGHEEGRVAERIAQLRERAANPEAEVAGKVAQLRQRMIQGSEQQVAQRIAALRDRYGTREPGHGTEATGTGPEGPVGVSGGGGAGLQGFLESRYVQGLRDHLNLYWSVPEALKGKGYDAIVSVIVDRRGKIVNWSVRRSGNRLFDEKVERAVAEADPLPPVPGGMVGERFEFELRFSAP
ncbi:MAG: cell envelope integrity protein TolA [Deltaproteobacteria bacterium]|nr:cell envelope integrity protein TolA [Deltaproteobacteria bacterium]